MTSSGRNPAFVATEEWRAIPGYEGRYEVSNLGRVRSLLQTIPKIRRTYPDKDGYPRIALSGACGRKDPRLHRLVAEVFHGDKRNSLHNEVAHLDGDRTNACADNLKWVSHAENHSHRRQHGTDPVGERHPRAKVTDKQALEILNTPKPYGELAEHYRVSWSMISDIKRGRRWKHIQSGVKVYGSERFRALTRNPALPVPARFEPTQKHPDDVVI